MKALAYAWSQRMCAVGFLCCLPLSLRNICYNLSCLCVNGVLVANGEILGKVLNLVFKSMWSRQKRNKKTSKDEEWGRDGDHSRNCNFDHKEGSHPTTPMQKNSQ